MTKRKRTSLIIYTILFCALWAICELAATDILNDLIANEILRQLVRDGIIKNLVWTVPALVLVSLFHSEVSITLKEMFTARVNWLKYLPIFIVFTVYLLAGAVLQNGRITVVDTFGIDDIIIVLFVGLSEETVFRGWLLNVTIREDKPWRYILINAVMFLAIHFPIWIHSGIFISNFVNFGFVSILALSTIFGWTFVKSRSIWVPVALHMYWDLLIFLFY